MALGSSLTGYSTFFWVISLQNLDKKITWTPQGTVGGMAYICFKWFQITADAHPGVSWVSNDQEFCEKFKNTHCQVDYPAKIE